MSNPRIYLALTLSLLLMSVPAVAQPVNDDFANATAVPGLPFTESISTEDATMDPDDPDCAGNGPTVWYSFSPPADGFVAANTFGSDYDTTLSVYTNSGDGLVQVACNDDYDSLQSFVVWEATAGTTYFLMVGSFASGPGGNLTTTVEEGQVPLAIDVTLDAKNSVVPKTGVATIKGTIQCNVRATVFGLSGQLEQRSGRAVIVAGWSTAENLECTPPSVAWTASAISGNGFFAGGKALVRFMGAVACGAQTCDEVFLQGPIALQLTGGKNK